MKKILRVWKYALGSFSDEKTEGYDNAIVVITHYQRLLDYIVPDFVHILSDGFIIKSGGPELAREVEKNGYSGLINAA